MSNTTAPKLTKRELQVVDMIGQGFRNKQIAMTLCIAEFTVRKHRANILGKLGLSTSAQLVAYAAQLAAPRLRPDPVFALRGTHSGRARPRLLTYWLPVQPARRSLARWQ